ncbi:MAG: NrfD/PsrC family molybdoenzyme membrane anchor subunit [Myxococcota bacterium]|nr:NrfD/PsrC family molybdoenzyme membrane anchor subunit [Myxococcota bacterium]
MTPPPAESVAAMIRPGAAPPDSPVNRDLLRVMDGTSVGYWILVLVAAGFVGLAAGIWIWQVYEGLGIAGYKHPVFWGAYIVTFVFWVGIAHAGTLISAILYLFRAKWRNAINRSAEMMTVVAVLTAAQFLGIHVGRIWKSYFILPYPNQRGLWVNFKSPLLWDTFAITTYLTISVLFLFVGLIPDFAIARDRASGWRKLLYSLLAGGWQGTSRQWKAHNRSVLHLSGLATPLVLSVHSVVSWDFAMSIVPGWHATVFGPYFVAGAIFSGFAMVLTVMIPMRRIYGLDAYITDYHLENMSRFLLLTSTIVAYAYGSEYFIAWYGGVEVEQTNFWLRAFGPYWISTWIMILCNGVFPQLLWIPKLRTNVAFLFVLSVLINIGMWFERYVIIITGLSREHDPAVWGIYTPSYAELGIVAGSFGFFALLFLLLIKIVPVVAIAEVKETVIHERMHGKGAH